MITRSLCSPLSTAGLSLTVRVEEKHEKVEGGEFSAPWVLETNRIMHYDKCGIVKFHGGDQ